LGERTLSQNTKLCKTGFRASQKFEFSLETAKPLAATGQSQKRRRQVSAFLLEIELDRQIVLGSCEFLAPFGS